jgi:hypothetical protein
MKTKKRAVKILTISSVILLMSVIFTQACVASDSFDWHKKITTSYYDDGKLIKTISLYYNYKNDLVGQEITEFFYDDAGQLTHSISTFSRIVIII